MTRHNRISSAALVVALLALVASLGGGSYAAKLLTGKDIKNGSIAGKDVKNSSLKGKDVKDKSLTGKDLKDGSVQAADLGPGTLEPPMATFRVAATAGPTLEAARTAAPERVLFSDGSLTVYAKCFTDTSVPNTSAVVYIRTTANGAVFASGEDTQEGGAATDFLNTDTPELDREVERETGGTNDANYWRNQLSAHGADGSAIAGVVAVGGKNGTLAGGDGVYGAGDACIFSHSLRSN